MAPTRARSPTNKPQIKGHLYSDALILHNPLSDADAPKEAYAEAFKNRSSKSLPKGNPVDIIVGSFALVVAVIVCILFIVLLFYLLVAVLRRKRRNFERIMVLVGLLVAASASYFTFIPAYIDLADRLF